jgi:hypothetical protein
VQQNPPLAPAQPVPPNVAQLAAATGLGSMVRVYVPKRRSWFLIVFMFPIALASTVILVGFWLLWALIRMPNLSRSMAARRVYLYEQGFILVERPDAPQAYRWDGIDTVFQKIVVQRAYGIKTATNYIYTITARDGRTTKLTHFWAGIDELGPHVNESVSRALLPGATAALERGQGVQFGDMTLNAAGISGRRKSVTWSEVKQVTVAAGYVRVGVVGQFLALSNTAAANLPNLPLFFTLVERMRQQSAAASG